MSYNEYYAADILYHELEAHVDGDQGDAGKEHDAFGISYEKKEDGTSSPVITKDSKAHKFLLQLEKVVADDKDNKRSQMIVEILLKYVKDTEKDKKTVKENNN